MGIKFLTQTEGKGKSSLLALDPQRAFSGFEILLLTIAKLLYNLSALAVFFISLPNFFGAVSLAYARETFLLFCLGEKAILRNDLI